MLEKMKEMPILANLESRILNLLRNYTESFTNLEIQESLGT